MMRRNGEFDNTFSTGYATWVIVRALCRDPGYSIDILPSYDLD